MTYAGLRGPQPDQGVADLPEFELTGERVASWVNGRLLLSCVEASEAET